MPRGEIHRWQTRYAAHQMHVNGPYDVPINGDPDQDFEYWVPDAAGFSVPMVRQGDWEYDYQQEIEKFCSECNDLDVDEFFDHAFAATPEPPGRPM